MTVDEKYQIKEREERETLDRAWASNDKVQFDNVISHNNVTARYAEIALSNAVNFQAQMNQEYLKETQMRLAHMDTREKLDVDNVRHRLEDNRYTLDRLYSVFPEEAAGLVPLLESIVKMLKKET